MGIGRIIGRICVLGIALGALCWAWVPAAADPAPADQAPAVTVAVAANFQACLQVLAADFTAATGRRIAVSAGSTGQLFAQICNGAPYALFFAADRESPAALEERGLTVPGTRFTYAVGQLVLITGQTRFAGAADPCSLLAAGDYRRLAVANPELSPYGRAAVQTLQSIGLWPQCRDRLAFGQTVSQVWQFVASGNADLGLVSLAQTRCQEGSSLTAWGVPADLHNPIVQQAVMMRSSEQDTAQDAAALAFLDFVRSAQGRAILQAQGYLLPAGADQDPDHAAP